MPPEHQSVKGPVKTRGFVFSSLDRTSAAKVATKARDARGTADCTLVHSTKIFLFNALMSCSTESSRTGSGIMIVAVNPGGPRHSLYASSQGYIPRSSGSFKLVVTKIVINSVQSSPYAYVLRNIYKNARQITRPPSGLVRR